MALAARFSRADRVVAAREYAEVRRRGHRLSSKNFAVSIAKREAPAAGSKRRAVGHSSNTRLGLSVSRRVGNAVVRNRVKRAIREWFRHSRSEFEEDVDIVVIARRGAAEQGVDEVARELSRLLSSQGAASAGGPRSAGSKTPSETVAER